ncbi:hypothetical protein AB0L57_19740 [Nocardia sp. NPDC052254]|uniref:hypothetical protein n=1 Tax=Nocardia sp. NPDC052254 TaxID=3155681 RepID=UPI003428AE42
MKDTIIKSGAVTALTTLALAGVVSTATNSAATPAARPSPTGGSDTVSVQVAPGAAFTGTPSTDTATLRTPAGALSVRDRRITVAGSSGSPLFGASEADQISSGLDRPDLDSRTERSSTTLVADVAAPADGIADLAEAWRRAGPYTSLASGVGATAGALTGMAIGCPVGAVTGGTLMTVVSAGTLTLPAAAAGCLAGAGVSAAFGGMVGGLAAGLPVGIAVTMQKLGEIQSERADPAPQTSAAPNSWSL